MKMKQIYNEKFIDSISSSDNIDSHSPINETRSVIKLNGILNGVRFNKERFVIRFLSILENLLHVLLFQRENSTRYSPRPLSWIRQLIS